MNIIDNIKALFNIETQPSYWEIRKELDIQHDKMIEEFAERSRQWDKRREQSLECLEWSRRCTNIVAVLSRKQLLSSDIFFDMMKEEHYTAYLPIEVGPILKRIYSERDSLLLHELYKANLK